MAAITTMDFVLLVTFNFHIYHPIDPNWNNFGWAYEWLPPMLWIQQPIVVIAACALGSVPLFKIAANINATLVCVTYPIVMFMQFWNGDDPMFHFILLFMAATKFAFSALSSKVVHTLINPGFSNNQIKIDQFMRTQVRRIKKREEILGKDANQLLLGMGNIFREKDQKKNKVEEVHFTPEEEAKMRDMFLK